MLKKLFGADKSSGLNCLVKANKDGENAYRRAAELVSDDSVKETFLRHAQQRAGYAAELAAHSRALGAAPPGGGSLLAKVLLPLKMAWIRMVGADTARIVSWAEAGEDCAMKAYDRALKSSDLRGAARDAVERQMSGIRESHATMRRLEQKLAETGALPEPR